MEEKSSSSNVAAEQSTIADIPTTEQDKEEKKTDLSAEKAGSEHRQAYGTAKTENLRDSGLWRILLPAFVVLLAVALIAVPLVILIPLLMGSLDPHSAVGPSGAGLLWLWIVMIILIVSTATFIIWGLFRIFMTQAGNYQR